MDDYKLKKLIWAAGMLPAFTVLAFNSKNNAVIGCTALIAIFLTAYLWYATFVRKEVNK